MSEPEAFREAERVARGIPLEVEVTATDPAFADAARAYNLFLNRYLAEHRDEIEGVVRRAVVDWVRARMFGSLDMWVKQEDAPGE